MLVALGVATASACAQPPRGEEARERAGAREPVRLGVTVLLEDSIALISGKRVALITNQTGVDANGNSDIELLGEGKARTAGVRLVRLFSPEHGIRGTEDRTGLTDAIDERSGLRIHSLYGRETIPPPDSLLRDLDALVFDLQDIGTRTWTYVGVMVYAMRAAARVGIPFIVLDRPNPISGRAEAPLLDSTVAYPGDPAPGRQGQAFALYRAPLRHGMTMGELARFFAGELRIPVRLHVIPMSGWRRSMQWEDTGLRWVVPSPAMTTPASAFTYPALVPFEATNLSVGRGTALPFQQLGAPWLRADSIAAMLNERGLTGVRFESVRMTPRAPTDAKFGEREIPAVRVVVEDRGRAQMGRVSASLLWAISRLHADSLRINARRFDMLLGDPSAREALVAGTDPDEVIDRMQGELAAWQRAMRPYLLYR